MQFEIKKKVEKRRKFRNDAWNFHEAKLAHTPKML